MVVGRECTGGAGGRLVCCWLQREREADTRICQVRMHAIGRWW